MEMALMAETMARCVGWLRLSVHCLSVRVVVMELNGWPKCASFDVDIGGDKNEDKLSGLAPSFCLAGQAALCVVCGHHDCMRARERERD